jgi:TRAP-type transport system periplasmic protein
LELHNLRLFIHGEIFMILTRQFLKLCFVAAMGLVLMSIASLTQAQTVLRVSTPAVADDWHAKMWTVMKDDLAKSAPKQFDMQINLNASLFKQGAEAAAMARGNLELSTLSAQDIAKIVPEFSIFTAGYVIRDPAHLNKVHSGPIGVEMAKMVSEKMDVTILAPLYLGTRQVNLRDVKSVRTPVDLKGVKLRMPGSKEWLFLGEALGASATPLAFGEVYLALKTGTIDGQDNPLPTVKSAKFYEVTKQIVMTSHLVDGLFISVSNKAWNAMSKANQAKLKAAAVAAAKYNDENRIRDEAQMIDFFKSQGLVVITPDVSSFRAAVQTAYQKSDISQTWPKGMLDRINATK